MQILLLSNYRLNINGLYANSYFLVNISSYTRGDKEVICWFLTR